MMRVRLRELIMNAQDYEEISEATGISVPTLRRVARGENTTINVLEKLCRFFDMDLDEMVDMS